MPDAPPERAAAPRAGRRVYWRAAVFNVVTAVLVLVVSLVAGPVALFLPRSKVREIANWWCKANLKALKAIVGIELEIRGREHIPQGPALVAVKHQSQLETFGLMPQLPDPTFVLKRELTWLPFFGWFLIKLRMIAINRSAGSEALTQILEQAQIQAREGRQIVIYPEGTRRKVGDSGRYKLGVTHLYERLGLACHPVAIDTGVFWPRDTLNRRQGRAVIEFLEPIPPGLPRETFQPMLRERIETASDALCAEALGAPAAASRPQLKEMSD